MATVTLGPPTLQPTPLLPPSPAVVEQAEIAMKRSWWATLALIALVALALRVMAIDRHSVWYDEAVTAHLTQASTYELLTGQARDLGNPPLFLILERAWLEVLGRSDASLRGLSVLVSLVLLPFLALLGARLFGAPTGLLAAALWAISPMAVELANEARAYSLLALLTTANAWFFVRFLDEGRRRDLLLYSVTLALAFWSHYYALGLPIVHGCALAFYPQGRRRLLPWLTAVGTAGLLFAPWLPIFHAQLTIEGNLARGGSNWKTQFLATPVVFCLGRTFAWRDAGVALHAVALVITVLGFMLPALVGAYQLRHRWSGAFLAAWWLGPTVGPLVVALLFSPIYATRYAFLALPAFLLVVGFGLGQVSRSLRIVCLGVLLAGTAVSLAKYVVYPLKDDWRSAARVLAENAHPGAVLAFDTDYEVTSYRYYAGPETYRTKRIVGLIPKDPDTGRLHGVIYRDGRMVSRIPGDCTDFVLDSHDIWVALCVPTQGPEVYQKFLTERGYQTAEDMSFHRIRLLHFVRPPENELSARLGSAAGER